MMLSRTKKVWMYKNGKKKTACNIYQKKASKAIAILHKVDCEAKSTTRDLRITVLTHQENSNVSQVVRS